MFILFCRLGDVFTNNYSYVFKIAYVVRKMFVTRLRTSIANRGCLVQFVRVSYRLLHVALYFHFEPHLASRAARAL